MSTVSSASRAVFASLAAETLALSAERRFFFASDGSILQTALYPAPDWCSAVMIPRSASVSILTKATKSLISDGRGSRAVHAAAAIVRSSIRPSAESPLSRIQ